MNVTIPYIEQVIDTESGQLNTIVIEEPNCFREIIEDIYQQIQGAAGRITVSEKGKILSVPKKVELLTQFIPFEINTKNILNKVTAALERAALTEEYYEQSMQILSRIEYLLNDLCCFSSCDVVFTKLNIGAIIKAVSPELCCDEDSLTERVLHYLEVSRELDGDKLYIIVNMRSFVPDNDMELYAQTVLSHGYHVLHLESSAKAIIPSEKRVLIDADLCEI